MVSSLRALWAGSTRVKTIASEAWLWSLLARIRSSPRLPHYGLGASMASTDAVLEGSQCEARYSCGNICFFVEQRQLWRYLWLTNVSVCSSTRFMFNWFTWLEFSLRRSSTFRCSSGTLSVNVCFSQMGSVTKFEKNKDFTQNNGYPLCCCWRLLAILDGLKISRRSASSSAICRWSYCGSIFMSNEAKHLRQNILDSISFRVIFSSWF